MTIKEFSRSDTNVFKGVAILCIMLHNFFHWIYPMTGENEFFFSLTCFNNLKRYIISDPLDIINTLFSYFGHYGVQLFIFISGYGLAVSFSKRQRSWGTFMIERLKKLYPLLLTGIIVFYFAKILIDKQLFSSYDINEIGWKLLFVQTLIPNSGLSVNGPWWFFALILQLYILFPLLLFVIKKSNTKGMIAIMLVSYVWIYITQYVTQCQWDVWLLQNAPGHLPEFVFGIWFALNKDKKVNNVFGFVALIVFALGNYYKAFFPMTFLSLVFFVVWIINPYLSREGKNKRFKRFLMFYGSISMILFSIHGYFRSPFIDVGNQINNYWGRLFVAVMFVACVTALSLPAEKIYKFLVKIFDKIHCCLQRITSGIRCRDKALSLISRVIQLALLLFAIALVLYYSYNPDFVREHQLLYENHFDIEPPQDALFRASTEADGNHIAIINENNLYSNILPHSVKIIESYRILYVELSFDIYYDESMNKDLLPYVIFSSDDNLWQSNKITFSSTEEGWKHIEIKAKLSFPKNPKDQILKAYFLNKHKQVLKYDNIDIKIHY